MIKIEPLDYLVSHAEILEHTQRKIREKRQIIRPYLKELNDQLIAYNDERIDYSYLQTMMVGEKQSAILFQKYNLKKQTVKGFKSFAKQLHDVLYELYDSDQNLIKNMKNEIKDKYKENDFTYNGERCPYCGILRQSPSVLDHFLPRSVFPEYSILTKNLVYICEKCNNPEHKSYHVNDADGIRLFLHPYTDDEIATYPLIKCSIKFDGLMVLPTFTINEDLLNTNEALYKIACNHMKTLKLNKRYSSLVENDLLQKFRNKFTELNRVTKVRRYKETIELDEIMQYVNEKIEECDETDINNWEIVFWKAFFKEKSWFATLAGQELENNNAET